MLRRHIIWCYDLFTLVTHYKKHFNNLCITMKDSTCIYHDPSYLYPYSNSKSENADIIFLRKYHDVITYGHIYIKTIRAKYYNGWKTSGLWQTKSWLDNDVSNLSLISLARVRATTNGPDCEVWRNVGPLKFSLVFCPSCYCCCVSNPK